MKIEKFITQVIGSEVTGVGCIDFDIPVIVHQYLKDKEVVEVVVVDPNPSQYSTRIKFTVTV